MSRNKHFDWRLWFILVSLLAGGAAYADKPSWAGGGGGKQQQHGQGKSQNNAKKSMRHEPQQQQYYYGDDRHYDDARRSYASGYFVDRQRVAVRDYYAGQFRSGHCPPGLAKKHNGCMPPGQAKKWAIGRPLPPDVVYYDLPLAVAMGIGPPPAGYEFVRVASDILMIAVGTGMVVDAIRDLGGF